MNMKIKYYYVNGLADIRKFKKDFRLLCHVIVIESLFKRNFWFLRKILLSIK